MAGGSENLKLLMPQVNKVKTMLPTVDFCGLNITRLIIGANPFGGFSHQNERRDQEMLKYYTVDRIKETWARAEAAGINAMVTNNESAHVVQAVREYLKGGGRLKWIAQVNRRLQPDMTAAVNEAVDIGCSAIYFHGAQVEELYKSEDSKTLEKWCATVRSRKIPVGVAGHAPEAHRWVDSLDLVDFHAVCFFDCGSVHEKKGEKFRLRDIVPAAETVRAIKKPCIAYKIMGAGRIDARMAFDFAFTNIKPTDAVNVGMHRGDNDNMVEENASIVREILS